MSILLRELLQIPQISLEVLAGDDGLDEPVFWAHACEMPEPWDWLGPQELLMTIGHCVPRNSEQQAGFIRELAHAGLVGVTVCHEPSMPTITKRMLRAADELSFPVLLAGHTTPYSVIARAVASANQHEQLHRLAKLSRLSRMFTNPAAAADGSMLGRIADELGHQVFVIDATYGTEILRGPHPVDPQIAHAVVTQTRPVSDRLPAHLHIEFGEQLATCFPVPSTRRSAFLVVSDADAPRIDPFAVLHVASLIAIEIERLSVLYAQRRQRSARLLRQLIDGQLDSELATEQLREFGLSRHELVAAALPAGYHVPDHVLMDRNFPFLLIEDRPQQIMLFCNTDAPLLTKILGRQNAIGTSDVIHALTHLGGAVREAQWALGSAMAEGGGHVAYASAHQVFLPLTVSEATNAVRKILGTISDYDHEHDADLISSLETYLACNRSRKRAAEILNIHRQTLGYRLKQIETLSDRQLSSTEDIAELWLALRALRRLTGEPGVGL